MQLSTALSAGPSQGAPGAGNAAIPLGARARTLVEVHAWRLAAGALALRAIVAGVVAVGSGGGGAWWCLGIYGAALAVGALRAHLSMARLASVSGVVLWSSMAAGASGPLAGELVVCTAVSVLLAVRLGDRLDD